MFPTRATPTPRLSPSHRKAIAQLGLTVLGGGLKLTVRCPYCPGVRVITPNLLVVWAKKGKVPTCEAVKKQNVGTHCRAADPAEGVGDAESA